MKKVADHLKETFGQKPNIENLRAFFADPIIQRLWFQENGFSQSQELKNILLQLCEDHRRKLQRYMEKVQPVGVAPIVI